MSAVPWLSLAALVLACLPVVYLYLLAFASIREATTLPGRPPRTRFAIAIPAHDEEAVIGRTVAGLAQMDYPADLYDIHVVADHCSDNTAEAARAAGAIAHERVDGPRGGKGQALRWLFGRVLDTQAISGQAGPYDAVVVFDADTHVDPGFLKVMDSRFAQGAEAVQGQHRISNPEDGWFPSLTWAMFLVDNRYQNLGRSNLGWSAKNMGDSICFQADVLRALGWGEGLTEDYALRQRLLLDGITIRYEPAAIGYGEAPLTWQTARAQRARWLRGTHDASRMFARQLWREGLKRRDASLLDGALQAYLPSYSTLTLLVGAGWALSGLLTLIGGSALLSAWTSLLALLMAYPLGALWLEKAPARAYISILSGPIFIVWRTWIALTARFGRGRVEWIRTPRKASQ